jgi:hypothetical protein
MSKKLIELDDGLMIEVDVPQNDIEMISGGGDMVDKVQSSMGTIEKMLLQSVQPIINTYNTLNQEVTLDSAEVEVGIGFSAEGNIFIAKGNANANLKVKLVLKPKI